MKTKLTIPITAVLCLAFVGVATAEQTIIAISPALPDLAAKNEVYRTVLTAALQDIAPGDSIQIIDGWDVKSVTTLNVPPHQAYARDPKARAKAMQTSIQAFNAWLTTNPATPSTIPACGLRTPIIFEFCATHTDMPRTKGRLVLIGTTNFDDPAEPAFSMKDGYYPADSHLGASRQESIYGLKDGVNRLEGVVVHWASLGTQYQDDGHRASVERWWSLYCQLQGCALASCDPSVTTVFQRFKSGSTAPIQRVTAALDEKLEMRHAPIRFRVSASTPELPVNAPPSAPQAEPAQQAVALAAPAEPVISSQPQLSQGPKMDFMLGQNIETQPLGATEVEGCRIGIRWPDNRDLDLYVRPYPGAEELFYGHNRSRDGIHIKDWLTSPDVDNNGFETVELPGHVDLTKLAVAVNFYAGAASPGGVEGTVRIETGGKIYQAPFHLAASTGNRGGASASRNRSPYWIVLDPLAITKQR